jgi:uncharacterized membrane protein HdeD (DUF308 family)
MAMSQAAVSEAARKSWPWLVLEGVLAIVFGVIAWVWPGITIGGLVLLFGAFAIADGIFEIVNSFTDRSDGRHRWIPIVVGIIGIIAGVVTFLYPGITAIILIYFIGAWAIARGIMQLIAAWQMRGTQAGLWWLAISGVLSIAFGIIVFVSPGAGAIALVWLIGAFASAFGILLILFGWLVRRFGKGGGPAAGAAAAY